MFDTLTPGGAGVVLACPDKFRGTVTAWEAAEAMVLGAGRHWFDGVAVPLADGGEGTLDVLALAGGSLQTTRVTGPLGQPVAADWLLFGRTAYIEMARASGLALAGGATGNDPLTATTRGTGELIATAMLRGAKRVVVTLGGSATTDGGLGALEALEPHARLRGISLVVACDVETGFTDAASVFGPQKGATPAQVKLLTGRLERLADQYLADSGVDVRKIVGAGAAGGLAGGLATLGATLVSGFDLVAEAVGIDQHVSGTQLVVTGEGYCDAESFDGKVVGGVCALAAAAGVPVLVVAGDVDPEVRNLTIPGEVTFVSLVERFGAERAFAETANLIADVVASHLGDRAAP
jgi:glycerate 2-kinase